MKRLFAILLTALIAAGMCACTEKSGNNSSKAESGEEPLSAVVNVITTDPNLPVAPNGKKPSIKRKYKEGEAPEWNLDNTYYKLTKEKKLNVAYIGGSVTVGTGADYNTESWRALTLKWFRETYPDAEINEINGSCGGTSSCWGIARYKQDVLDKKPDLIFIEFSVNDVYSGLTESTSAAFMDAMIRETNRELPNCDIVYIRVPDNGTFEHLSDNAAAHKKAAKYNGVTWLDMAEALREAIAKNGTEWNDYITDAVHPNAKGYKVYADYIAARLKERFAQSKKRGPAGLTAHTVPTETYTDNTPIHTITLWADDLKYNSDWKKAGMMKKSYFAGSRETIRACKEGAAMTFQFEGSTFAIYGDFKKNSNVKFTLDGQNEKTIGTINDQSGERLIYDNLTPGVLHTVTVTAEGTGLCSIVAVFIG